MNLKNLSDLEIRARAQTLRARERETLGEILKTLREVERRRLYSEFGFKSLFDYAVRELRYSEDEAYRRINAMRIVREIPEVQAHVERGELSLSSLSVAKKLFRAEPMDLQRKTKVLKAMRNKTKRESEQVASEFRSQPVRIDLRVEATAALEEKIARVKGLLAHSHPQLSTGELFEKLCDDFLEAHEQKMRKSVQTRNAAANGRRPALALKREIWRRDGGRCTNCGSQHALEYDHIVPVAMGGGTRAENLRLLCRSCNQRVAIVKLGGATMTKFLT